MQVIIAFLLLFSSFAVSQSSSTFDNSEKKETTFFGLQKNDPTNAMLLGIIPGGGQIYNGSYWKAALLFGGGIALTANVVYNNRQFNQAQELISNNKYSGNTLENLKLEREFYRDTRDRMGFFILILYLVSTVDAYVGAKLNQFDVGDDISFYAAQNSLGMQVGIRVNIFE